MGKAAVPGVQRSSKGIYAIDMSRWRYAGKPHGGEGFTADIERSRGHDLIWASSDVNGDRRHRRLAAHGRRGGREARKLSSRES
jgi:hypothetical protein